MEFSSPHICISKLSWGKMWVNVTKKFNKAEEMNAHKRRKTDKCFLQHPNSSTRLYQKVPP